MSAPRPIVIAANAAWNLVNFRAALIRALIARGHPVIAAAPADPPMEAALRALGARFAAVPIDSKGVSPRADLGTMIAFLRLFRAERPAAFLGYTVKPNVYGSIAARIAGVPAINNISGLGTAFIRRTWLTPVVERLYRIGLARSRIVFFQNVADRDEFVAGGLVCAAQTRLVSGSGIDTAHFSPRPRPPSEGGGGPAFLLIARLVRDKGVLEFVEAARIVRRERPEAVFRLLGFLDVENRTAIDRATVRGWVDEGIVTYLGAADDVRPHVAAADCVVLPSYREGTSRVLLEAAAMAKPIVATDVPGCREVVEDGVTGFLARVRDAGDLARRLLAVAEMDGAARERMGQAGRAKVEREFGQARVIEAYLRALDEAIAG